MRWRYGSYLILPLLLLLCPSSYGYENDVHYHLTKYLAHYAGFSETDAEQIASADEELDTKPEFNPMPNPNFCPKLSLVTLGTALSPDVVLTACKDDPEFQRMLTAQRAYHFVDGKRLQELRDMAFRGKNLKTLGRYLHALQDTFAHSLMDYADLPPLDKLVASLGHRPDEQIIGHLLHGHSVDKTNERPDLAQFMAQYVYAELTRFTGSKNRWSDVEAAIARFVREKELQEKLAHLALSFSTHQTPAPNDLAPTQFLLENTGFLQVGSCSTPNVAVLGIIPDNPDFRDEKVAEYYLSKGLKFFHEQCSSHLQRSCEEGRMCQRTVYVKLAHARYVDIHEKKVKARRIEVSVSFLVRASEALSQARQLSIRNYARERYLFHDSNRITVNLAENRAGAAAKYRIRSKNPNYCNRPVPDFDVIVEVPPGLDLSNHVLASAYLTTGLRFGLGQCDGRLSDEPGLLSGLREKDLARERNKEAPCRGWGISVFLYQDGEEKVKIGWRRMCYLTDEIEKTGYKNLIAERKQVEDEARQKTEKARREAEQKEAALRPIRERLNTFLRQHGVERVVSCDSLERNPFALERKTIGLRLSFEQMIAKDQGVFGVGDGWGGGCGVAVSGIPHGTFSTQRVKVFLVGKVLGNTKINIGKVTLLVPHLNFVGVHICKDEKCSDIVPEE